MKKFFIFIVLFIVSFLILFLSYYQLIAKKKIVLSPLAIIPTVLSQNTSQTKDISVLLQKYNIQFDSITLASQSAIVIALPNGKQAIISVEKPLQPQISSLQLMISRLTIEGKEFKRIDVRFDRPVISTL